MAPEIPISSEAPGTPASAPAPPAPAQPNIHVQRLQAIGNFFTSLVPTSHNGTSTPPRADSRSGADSPRPRHSPVLGSSDAQTLSGHKLDLHIIEGFIKEKPSPQPKEKASSQPSKRTRRLSASANDLYRRLPSQDGSVPAQAAATPLTAAPRPGTPKCSPDLPSAGRPPASPAPCADIKSAASAERAEMLPAAGVQVAEVFENERRQPFRGWGHSWPGHFLPTDSLGHWCDGSGRSVGNGDTFQANAPPLPDGWAWCAQPGMFSSYSRSSVLATCALLTVIAS